MSGDPVISVVLPVKNGAPYLRQAARSILEQTRRDFEFLIVDDASTDDTPAVLRDLAGADPRVVLPPTAGRGLIAELNAGCAAARGLYLARMDADDVALPDRLEKQAAFLDAHPGVAVVGGGVQFFSDRGALPRLLRHPGDPAAIRAALASGYSCFAHPTIMMRKAAWEAAGRYRPAFIHAEDYDLWLRISERHDLANLPDVVLQLRLHPGQVSTAQLLQQALSAQGARAAAARRRAGLPDGGDRPAPVDRRALLDLGLEGRAIDAAVVAAHVARAALALDLGLESDALAVAASLAALPFADVRRRARGEAAWIEGKVALRRGRTARGAAAIARACRLHPALLLRLLRAATRGAAPAWVPSGPTRRVPA